MHWALLLFVSLDVRRSLPVVKCLGVLCLAFGAGMIVLDQAVGMPWFWLLGEGPFIIALGGAILWLSRGCSVQTRPAHERRRCPPRAATPLPDGLAACLPHPHRQHDFSACFAAGAAAAPQSNVTFTSTPSLTAR